VPPAAIAALLLAPLPPSQQTTGGFLSEIGGVCRVNGNLNLSRAIGDLKYKGNVELPPKDQIITAQPDVRKITLQVCDGIGWGRGR
jgi:hypothetical protein